MTKPMDLQTKIAAQVGALLLSSIELGHRLEGANAAAAAQQERADNLQALIDAAKGDKPAAETVPA